MPSSSIWGETNDTKNTRLQLTLLLQEYTEESNKQFQVSLMRVQEQNCLHTEQNKDFCI